LERGVGGLDEMEVEVEVGSERDGRDMRDGGKMRDER
jgi:hypothetical protein